MFKHTEADMMIKEIITNWIIKQLKNSALFNEFVNHKMYEFYKNDTLSIYRVWGDNTKVIIGKHVQINDALINTVSGYVSFGDYSFCGHSVRLLTGTHDISKNELERQSCVPSEGRDIVIGSGVWIASQVVILGPCEIGDNTVIGAGSLVTGKIEANSLYAGNPAKYIRKIGINNVK